MTDVLQQLSLSQLSLYNPARMSDPEIVGSFATRFDLFDRIVADIMSEKPKGRPQHHLLIGQRGMGKSTLLARIAAEIRTESARQKDLIALSFPEEQYSVDRLSKFWLNCLDALADACEREGNSEAVDRIDLRVRQLGSEHSPSPKSDEATADKALKGFREELLTLKRRPVLLVDNFQLVFERLSHNQEYALRAALTEAGAPIVIGACPSPPDTSEDYGKAFYDSFKMHPLGALDVVGMQKLMLGLADRVGRPDLRKRIEGSMNRIKVLRELTGGNPRTTVTLFFLFAEDFAPSVFGDLENLLDRMTPLYKARFEELSDQQQVIASAVANHWDPITAKAIGESTGIRASGLTSQLERLTNTGLIERVDLFGQSAGGYQIAERFFNVWFLMRNASRRQRREVEFLTRFIESFYDSVDRGRLVQHVMTECNLSPDRHLFVQALAGTVSRAEARELQRHAKLDALSQKEREARRRLEEVIDFEAFEPEVLAFSELRKRLESLVSRDCSVTPADFADAVLEDRQLFRAGRREQIASMPSLDGEKIDAILKASEESRKADDSRYGAEAGSWLRRRLKAGHLVSLNSKDDWEQALDLADDRNRAQLLVDTITIETAKQVSQNALGRIVRHLKPEGSLDPGEWEKWAGDIRSSLGAYELAETGYRYSIKLDSTRAFPWSNLGYLLQEHLGRYEESERAYREAIKLDPNDTVPWNNLGNLLQGHLGRYEESERAYREAIKLDPNYAPPWNNLGNLLQVHLGRYEESERAYREAIKLDPNDALPWNNLGCLLQVHLGRYEESETAYREAMKLDPNDALLWCNLGILLQDHLGRYEESETAYREAMKLDPNYALLWCNLGNLFSDFLGRYDEARAAFEKAIEKTNGSQEMPIENMIFLLRDFLGDFGSAREYETRLRDLPCVEFKDVVALHSSLFAAYEENWGLARKALVEAMDLLSDQLPKNTWDDWMRASAVFFHLGYGDRLIQVLRDEGLDRKLRPWFEALVAIGYGDRNALKNVALEVRKMGEFYYDQIKRRLDRLPEKTRRWSPPSVKRKKR